MDAGKATRIDWFNVTSPQMRAFHLSWMSFFLCFFGWFGLAPLLTVIREDLGITTDQIITTNMLAVGSTVLMRLLIGYLCDRLGPRLTYTGLLILGAFPVMLVGLCETYTGFLFMRMAIGMIGASFVITQAHTSAMFAPNCVGAANATTAGWGNLGGGATQIIMPLVFAVVLGWCGSESLAWRWAMVPPGVLMLIMGVIYYRCTQDTPTGNKPRTPVNAAASGGGFGEVMSVMRNPQMWILFAVYGLCFGVELLVNANAVLYFVDSFELNLKTAGLLAGLFGLMNIFARSLGGYVSDRFARSGGLGGRAKFLVAILFLEGCALMIFSQMVVLSMVIVTLLLFSLCVQMAEGATFAIVPFVDRARVGLVSGFVGAGGNMGAVLLMFLFKKELTGITWSTAFLYTGGLVVIGAFLATRIRFSTATEQAVQRDIAASGNSLGMPVTSNS